VRYEVVFEIPEAMDERILGRETVHLTLSDASNPLVCDFRTQPEDVLAVRVSEEEIQSEIESGHIVVPASALVRGNNAIQIEFLAGDMSLNRNPEFLYSLFVPDRAATAFPTFDQPNIKAIYQLTLTTPSTWRAVANGPLVNSDTAGNRVTHVFGATNPLSTYLFSFAAGEFQVETAERAGRVMQMFHRETDAEKVARNREMIFDLHGTALEWLEEYTAIPYPFEKFDFVAIPSFQYGGMEHAGAILYRASRLFLDESATQSAELGRAGLIAHETAHMWFGDLVTMNWFDDVWMKEVFANLMAAKIVNPSFPEIDHELRFFGHYPAAYSVDRTEGANPIRQDLDNMMNAGTLYGAIIYQKAPIVMRQLELVAGEEAFRQGIREYLSTFSYGNATWSDLIEILDPICEEDLETWSEIWVDQPDRPTIATELSVTDGRISSLRLVQSDPKGEGRVWSQHLRVAVGTESGIATIPVHMETETVEVEDAEGIPAPNFVLASGEGLGYGLFRLDDASREQLLADLPAIDDALTRSAAWVTLWDAVLEGDVLPGRFIDVAMRALPEEPEELNVGRILGYLSTAYWDMTNGTDRADLAPDLESLLWDLMEDADNTSLKATYFSTYSTVFSTATGVNRIRRIWDGDLSIEGLPLAERDFTRMAQQLALRGVPDTEEILAAQLERVGNPDRKASFEFSMPALSGNPAVRDSFFQSLRDPRNREHEPWVLTGVGFLHHPLRIHESEKYMLPSLELVEEIQRTGDIFFPKRWLDTTLGNHNTLDAVTIVREFLEQRPDYPSRLRSKILQSADQLFRVAEMQIWEESSHN
jgi:aminopeptidase N